MGSHYIQRMTTTQLTQEEKRIKIGEFLGYSRCIGGCQPKGEKEPRYWRTPSGREVRVIPDYFDSFDAIQSALMTLKDDPYGKNDQWLIFGHALRAIIMELPLSYRERFSECALMMRTTAAQRAEAFGKTLNLWP